MIKTKKLKCGINMVMEFIPHVRSASIGIWAKTGAVDESKSVAGISHLIEHMIFKGTQKRSAKEIAEDVDKIGSQINAFTGKETTCYYIKSLSSNVDKSIDIVTDIFMNSVFDKNEIEKEKLVIYEEMKMIEDSPEDDIHEIICDLVFNGTPQAQPVIGTKSAISKITKNRIMNYLESEYTEDSVVVSIAGNFDEKEVVALFEEKLAGLKKTKAKKTYPEAVYVPRLKVKVKKFDQAHICLGLLGVKLDDRHYYPFALLNNIFGGTMSARLFQSIREEKGLAYSVYSSSSSFVDTGIFSIYAGVSHEKVKETVYAIKEELYKLKKDGVTKDELSAAKEQIKGSYIFGQENVNVRMFSNGKNMTLLGRILLPEEVIGKIDKVTQDDIDEVSDIIKDIENYSAAVITNRKADLAKWMEDR